MADPNIGGIGFVALLAIAFAGIANLIKRGTAAPGVVVILLIMPFLYLLGLPMLEGEMPLEADSFSSTLIIGIIASVIGGIILSALKRK